MSKALFRLSVWLAALNSVDLPGQSRIHRFLQSARLGLWPAIILISFAFAQLLEYDRASAAIIAVNLCFLASFAFLFNDALDTQIDATNGICRWSVRSRGDLYLFSGAVGVNLLALVVSFLCVSPIVFAGLVSAALTSIAYSLFCKRVFLLGNLVAATLSLSPGFIIMMDVTANSHLSPRLHEAAMFLGAAFLLLVSREIKFDQFDLPGDRIGKRVTVPMFLGNRALNLMHALTGVLALFLLASVLLTGAKYSVQINLLVAVVTTLLAAALMLRAYRSSSKETFYKTTRVVMLIVPVSILTNF
jgi:4-hydroxybenzoate polyprenyltransferase